MKRIRSIHLVVATCIALCPALALAHPGHGEHLSFMAGALHPLTGIDHLLALIAVGLLAARMGGRSRLTIPAAFIALSGVGIALGFAGIEFQFVELAVAASVVVCGLLAVVPPRRLPLATAAIAGFFAVFHGIAHGTEVAEGVTRAQYAAGLLASSAFIIALSAAAASVADVLPARRAR